MGRLEHVRKRLAEFRSELAESDDPIDQFQVGYYVHCSDIEALLLQVDTLESRIAEVREICKSDWINLSHVHEVTGDGLWVPVEYILEALTNQETKGETK